MTNTDIKFLIVMAVAGIFGVALGLHGILNKKKINRMSDYYMSINLLLGGMIIVPLFLFSLLFFWLDLKGMSPINKKTYYVLATEWGAIAFLISGLHGIINKKKINNKQFYGLCVSGVISSLIAIIGMIAIAMKWGWW